MRVIGLTGGVGAGKSLVSDLLHKRYGAEVILADEVSHDLMESGQPGYQAVVEALGDSFLKPDGSIDRAKLAGIIFKDDKARNTVNSIIHPMTWKTIEEKISASQADLIVVEFAVVSKRDRERFDELWYVRASIEVRAKRLRENRGYDEARIKGIMDSQLTEEEFMKIADRVIDNDGSIEDLRGRLSAILDEKETKA